MVNYTKTAYDAMLGNISHSTIVAAAQCISQCTGCMCNCRCSCYGGMISDFEWEEM
ncbi:FibroRumin family radical SAM-modified Cys-rich RiPP [Bacillus sp. DNRA2]|uniref:FibroRumin family radical SAM-modified Cys-rich RiPP n=1 Tax=Bacillus sp. DNRA2 TaxID=2723053 RepID=UPI00145C990D|nr:FibroRumin family radical SAM-modified Cys-rich RiPP [Bacillus sp. DNRA2]NMD71295.1 FibroRumin family radical SAM-modified Cys-rich RiPP [Bacillus sp. DNRA2]